MPAAVATAASLYAFFLGATEDSKGLHHRMASKLTENGDMVACIMRKYEPVGRLFVAYSLQPREQKWGLEPAQILDVFDFAGQVRCIFS